MTNKHVRRIVWNEDGIALVLSLYLMAAMSVLGAALMFLSQTETRSSMNYRQMSQARYGAESGIQVGINYLINSYTPPPGVGGTDPLSNYDMTVSPVTYNGQPVILSANASVASNYPVASVQNGFSTATQGSLPSGQATVSYAPYAKLLSMQQIQVYGGGLQTIQTWEVTSDGSISVGAATTATVQVTSIIETQKVPASMYGAFGTSDGCGALTFSGSSTTDSYDSSLYSGSGPVSSSNGGLSNTDGNVGTNGNLGESGSATINGSLSTPRVGVGSCSDGNVDALSQSGHATVTGGVVQLPQEVILPTPALPSPLPPTTDVGINASASCATLGLTLPATCSGSAGNLTINGNGSPVSLGNLALSGGANLTLVGGTPATYDVNSISLTGNSTITVAPGTGTVVVNVAGLDSSGNLLASPIDLSGGSTSNSSMDASKLQFEYAGTGQITLNGNNSSAAMVYAPNAALDLTGDTAFYGSLVGKTLIVPGNAGIHFDRHLNQSFFSASNAMMTSFSWKKY